MAKTLSWSHFLRQINNAKTAAFGAVETSVTDPEQIETAIGQMARHIGMNQLQASGIQKIVAEFSFKS